MKKIYLLLPLLVLVIFVSGCLGSDNEYSVYIDDNGMISTDTAYLDLEQPLNMWEAGIVARDVCGISGCDMVDFHDSGTGNSYEATIELYCAGDTAIVTIHMGRQDVDCIIG